MYINNINTHVHRIYTYVMKISIFPRFNAGLSNVVADLCEVLQSCPKIITKVD